MLRPYHTPEAPKYADHPCRGTCGGHLHVCCGEVDSLSDSEMHRISPASLGETEGKRKATDHEEASNKKQATRARRTLKQKRDVLDLVDNKMLHSETPLPYSILVESCGLSEGHAENGGVESASEGLREAKMAVTAAFARGPQRQTDMRAFLSK